MALLGHAALAMWWDMAPAMLAEFEHWHTHEHYPERLAIPGFRRASRWRDAAGGDGIFQLYELADYGVLSSPAYLARLNSPTPWSTRMMPHHRNMARSQCKVLESHGGVTAAHALTVRLAPASGVENLRRQLQPLLANLAGRSGIGGAHLLQHSAPPIAATAEQNMRGGDAVADCVLIVTAYHRDTVERLPHLELEASQLEAAGAAADAVFGHYQLSYSATPADIA